MESPRERRPMTGRRAEVLSLLRAADAPLSIAQIAEELAVHPNTVRFHLDALLEKRQVQRAEAGHPQRRGRPAQLFEAVRGMDPDGPRSYRLLAEALVSELAAAPDASARAVATGRAWGKRLGDAVPATGGGQPVPRLIELLTELGFEPQHRPESRTSEPSAEATIELRNCPFLELTQDHADVICPVHLGLMQGAVAAWDAPVSVDALTPFAEPDRCVAHLTAKGA